MSTTERRQTIHRRIRKVVSGTKTRPRLAVYRSLNNLHAQLIDDEAGKTLAAATSLKTTGSLVKKATAVGETIAEAAKGLKISAASFDRGGFAYRGAIKALCDAARAKGLSI